jgi:ABC-type amino acid transport substrate-binding protein
MKFFFVVSALFFSLKSYGNESTKPVIRAAVAEEFREGLHSKYLKYFADKLNVTLELTTMPFARRVAQIKSGELDLIVGIQKTEARQDEFIYIMPHYELLSYRIFALKKDQNKIKSYQDLAGKYVGVNRYAKYFKAFDEDDSINKFKASGVIQNIELLLRNRIDAFIHYEQSTLPLLEKFDEENSIVKTPYQPKAEVRHYLAVSSHSVLAQRQNELRKIIANAIKNKDLLTIRLNHYAEIHQRKAA